MGGGGTINGNDSGFDRYSGYDDDLGEANNAEFGGDGAPMILAALAEGVASAASDAEEALIMCRDLAAAEDLSEADYFELVAQVEARTGWELPEEGEEL